MNMSLGKKLLCWLLCAAMLLGMAAPALAEETTLRLEFRGLRATTDGWENEPLSGVFTVMQGDRIIGTLEAAEAVSETIALDGNDVVRLIPEMDTMPEGYMIAESGYAVSVTVGLPNIAPVVVYAAAGLFEVQAESAAEFVLVDVDDEIALSFATDDAGFYALPEAIPAGVYALRQTSGEALMEDKVFELPVYRGNPDQIIRIDEAFVSQPELLPGWAPTEAPTAVPTETPTAVPTEVPTEIPTEAPTEVPTEVPTEIPTEVPTEVPTEIPTEAPTEVPTEVPTEIPTEAPTEVSTEIPTEVPTEVPTEIPTEIPTEAPTEVPTEIPTEVPTATPTSSPTPVPTPAEGVLRLDVAGNAGGEYILATDGNVVASGSLQPDQIVMTDKLPEGTYTLTLTMGNGVMLASLNGQPTEQFGQAQWQVAITAGEESLYTLELSSTAGVSGLVNGVDEAVITAASDRGSYETSLNHGAFAFERLYPDTYTVTVHLPAGEYLGVGWTLMQVEGGVDATISLLLESGTMMGLPALDRVFYGSISGQVVSGNGAPISGATVALIRDNGAEAGRLVADGLGAWRFDNIPNGTYTLRASGLGDLSAADRTVTMAGQNVTDVQITAAKTGILAVSAFVDSNDNGGRGNYESFLAGVEVSLYAAGSEPTLIATGVTEKDANEYWAVFFENVPAGEYFVRTVVPEGYGYSKHLDGYRTMDNLMYPSEQREQDSEIFRVEADKKLYIGIGALPLASLSGSVWVDLNGDGLYQEGEPGHAGVTITLERKSGETYTLITDGSDTYSFDNILPGKYTMTVTLPDGMMFTRDAARGNKNRSLITTEGQSTGSVSVTLEAGKQLTGQNVGLLEGSGIAGICFQDANYNGLYDEGEPMMPGVKLVLTQQGKTKALAETVSAEDGSFSFPGLRGGVYAITATLPDDGSMFTAVNAEGNLFAVRVSRRDQTVDNLHVSDSGTLHMVIGAVYASTVGGVAYLDDNFSGALDSGEQTVRGLKVTLLNASDTVIAEASTGSDGRYSFEGLMPGSYRLTLSAQAGYAFTKMGEGNVIVNTGNGTGSSELFDVTLGSSLTEMHMGMILPGVVEGVVFADLNDNGIQDEGETGLPGTIVRLMERQEGEAFSATVDEDGAYRFDAVMPGSYYLRFELPEGGVFSAGSDVEFDGSVGESKPFSFKAGDHVTGPVCGGVALGRISGVAFEDISADGVMDEDERPMAGVVITLSSVREDIADVTVTTGADGSFTVADLRPGDYQLTLTYPENYVSSRMSDGVTLPVRPGQATQTVPLTVAMGDHWKDQRLGGVRSASLTGRVWLDENNDGVCDPNEATPAGERVTVIDQTTGEVFAELTTDENGVFAVSGLVPGDYTVSYTLAHNAIAPQPGDSTFAEEGGALVMRNLTAIDGCVIDGLLLGVVKLTSIGGTVWHDDGKVINALEGAQVMLMDGSGRVIVQMQSGSDGSYRFRNLTPGEYQLGVVLPEGQVVVEPGDDRLEEGGQISVMTNCRNREATSDVFTLAMGDELLSMNIGSVLPGRLGDRVWLDENGNGLQDLDEGGIPNVLVELLRDGEVVESTTSDQYGFYFFPDVYPATYTLRVTAPDTVKPTVLRLDYPAAASVLMETGESVPVTVASDSRNYNADLGFVLVTPGVYPEGYGNGAQQDWTRIGW